MCLTKFTSNPLLFNERMSWNNIALRCSLIEKHARSGHAGANNQDITMFVLVFFQLACLSCVSFMAKIFVTPINKLCGRPPQYAPAPCDLDLRPFDLESGVQVTCDVGYRCANFSLRKASLFLTQARCTRQTGVRRQTASSLNAPA